MRTLFLKLIRVGDSIPLAFARTAVKRADRVVDILGYVWRGCPADLEGHPAINGLLTAIAIETATDSESERV